MKVLFITRKWPPSVGGMEKYCFELTQELSNSVNLKILYLKIFSNIKFLNLLYIGIFFLKSIFVCHRNHKTLDLVHLGDLSLWPIALFCRLINRNLRLVVSVHGTDVAYHLRPGIYPAMYKIYLRLASFFLNSSLDLIANSKATARHIEKFKFKSIFIVPLGVRARQSTNLISSNNNKFILFVGRLARRKGLSWFIKNVLPELPKEIRLKVAGVKWDDDEFKTLASSDRVDYLGPVYGDALAKLRMEAIAVIMPNLNFDGKDFEGFGLTAIEAAADGGVILASQIDGINDAVVDGETGFLLPSASKDDWIKKINEISSWSPQYRKKFIIFSRRYIEKNFTWDLVAKRTLEVYKQN